jgi:integrase
MIYKRGKCKLDSDGKCEKCGKRGSCGVYWYKFMWLGKLVRESTKQGNDKVARSMESAHRTSLAKGEVGIREKTLASTLAEFLKKDFLPYTDETFKSKPATARYYRTGAKSLEDSRLSGLRIDEISDQHARQYASRLSHLSPSTVNCGLRTLRRALYLAAEWGKTDRRPKITLAKGERQRERVLNDSEVDRYLKVCEQPWRDCATIMLGTGMRPGEVFALRWESVLLNTDGTGLVQITRGKSKAARRVLPMLPPVYDALHARWTVQNEPAEGWIFPSGSACGHFEGSTAKGFHARALKNANDNLDEDELPELKRFEPYVLRHTALTRLGENCDAFTLARIAGHSSITITQRYVHPQADAIERAFSKLGGHKTGHSRQTAGLLPAQESSRTALVRNR